MSTFSRIIILLLVASTLATAARPLQAQTWTYGASLGSGSGHLSDNIGRIPDDDVKIPTTYGPTSGPGWSLDVGKRLSPIIMLQAAVHGWSSRSFLSDPELLFGALSLGWEAGLGFELQGGVGYGLCRVTYLEQGLESTTRDSGMGVSCAVAWRCPLAAGWALVPRFRWFGFTGRDVEVWAASHALTLGLTWSPKETS